MQPVGAGLVPARIVRQHDDIIGLRPIRAATRAAPTGLTHLQIAIILTTNAQFHSAGLTRLVFLLLGVAAYLN